MYIVLSSIYVLFYKLRRHEHLATTNIFIYTYIHKPSEAQNNNNFK